MPIPEKDFDARAAAGGTEHLPPQPSDKPIEETPLTRAEVQDILNKIVESIKTLASKIDNRFALKGDVAQAVAGALWNINSRGFVDENRVKQIAKDAVPLSLRGLDSDSLRKTGDTLKLSSNPAGDSAFWGVAAGFNPAGDKVLYKGIFLREYDENGTIVAAGSDINPADYATQVLYEAALTAAGHTLTPTWDWVRSGTDITP